MHTINIILLTLRYTQLSEYAVTAAYEVSTTRELIVSWKSDNNKL